MFRHTIAPALLACAFSLPAWAGDLSVQTSPDSVTIYPSGARVLRKGQADLPAGPQTLVMEDLPAGLDPESLRLKMEGPKGTTVFEVKLREAFSSEEKAAKRAKLEAQVQALEDQKTDSADRIASRKAEAEILKALADKAATKSGSESGAKVSELAASVGQVGKRLESLALAVRQEERSQRQLERRLAALKAELDQIGHAELKTRVAAVEVELAQAGPCRFELSYFVEEASWAPRYDLRLAASDKEPKVELDFLAELRQQSGEAWDNVALSLSTALPLQDSQVPDPTQWWLDYRYPVSAAPMRMMLGAARSKSKAMAEEAPAAALAPAPQAPAFEQASDSAAQVQDQGVSALFTVKRRASVPSMDQSQRVTIAKSTLPATLKLVAVPRLSPAAFLEAKIVYTGEAPLLAGPAQLFRDGDLAGIANLPLTMPGEAFDLGFGMDEHIKVSRKRRTQKSGSAGLFNGKDKRSYDWDIKVANYHDGPRDIEVREQLPRSRQDGIKVTALELDPKPSAEDPLKPGLLRWDLTLAKGQEQALRLRYEVRWPEDKLVTGLE